MKLAKLKYTICSDVSRDILYAELSADDLIIGELVINEKDKNKKPVLSISCLGEASFNLDDFLKTVDEAKKDLLNDTSA